MRSGSALSGEAKILDTAKLEKKEHNRQSFLLSGRLNEAQSQLIEAGMRAGNPGWDGGGGLPVSEETLGKAFQLILGLPQQIPIPEFCTESDGSVNLEWHGGYRRMFTVNVGSRDRLPYAALDGTDRHHGVVSFDVGVAPKALVDGITRIIEC